MSDNILDICQVNIRSLNNDKINAISAELALDYDIICITETKDVPKNQPYMPHGKSVC